ncbi:hypothetical protein SAMN05216417_10480 [Nitrosospira multiformis]|uniref:Uncharacterized protein n=1 Tax=Nitrosospira multiformis TaxID=1231 RepID=A0A1I7GBB5_9PROT|nr:hypothetical protein SAMN05216417_10480 [Nitrosospira multiformis]
MIYNESTDSTNGLLRPNTTSATVVVKYLNYTTVLMRICTDGKFKILETPNCFKLFVLFFNRKPMAQQI